MIREIGATIGGLVSAVAVFLLIASSPLSPSAAYTDGPFSPTLTAMNRSAESLNFPGFTGVAYGIGAALILVLIALLTGVMVSRFVPRAAKSGVVD